jgi:hypothetical protein
MLRQTIAANLVSGGESVAFVLVAHQRERGNGSRSALTAGQL